jgi:3D (Asp-Asp-Asp) domain-containing protein
MNPITYPLEPYQLRRTAPLVALLGFVACASGERWVKEPGAPPSTHGVRLLEPPPSAAKSSSGSNSSPAPNEAELETEYTDAPGKRPLLQLDGSAEVADAPPDAVFLGVFRNTYYDFPAASDFSGPKLELKAQSCQPIAKVPRAFFEALCVQGSGTLEDARTVSFGSRDCSCAESCPKTGQRICFDVLDSAQFPWGRGAMGSAITPLKSVAVDTSVIPLGTSLYIAEFDGVSRGPGGSPHDGCFIAEDRGIRVVGEHVDIFAGNPRMTVHLNQVVPSNHGVHVYTRTARCQ